MRFAPKYRHAFRTSDILTSDCLAAVQIELLRSRVEKAIGFYSSLDMPNQFLAYVCLRFGSLLPLDENGNIISFFGVKRQPPPYNNALPGKNEQGIVLIYE